jgi:hypothetical protein
MAFFLLLIDMVPIFKVWKVAVFSFSAQKLKVEEVLQIVADNLYSLMHETFQKKPTLFNTTEAF